MSTKTNDSREDARRAERKYRVSDTVG